MTTGHVFIAISLDGYIARLDGGIDWLTGFATGNEDHGYDDHMARMDAIVMGRGTYEKAVTFENWPYEKPVIVVSRTANQNAVPAHLQGKVEIENKTPSELMAAFASKGWARVYVDGGKLIQSFLREGLIEDMTISRIPILIGKGLPLFGDLAQDCTLAHQRTTAFASGLVQSVYKVGRPD